MPKISKNLGKTVPCPACKEPIVYQASYTGEGKEISTCPHCGERFKRTITQKMIITLSKIVIVVIIVGMVYSIFSVIHSPTEQHAQVDIKPHE